MWLTFLIAVLQFCRSFWSWSICNLVAMNDDTHDVSKLGFKKVFVVESFPCLSEVELVPKNWLFNDKDITKCYWPNVASHRARKICVRYHKSSSQWKTYTVQVIYETSKSSFTILVFNILWIISRQKMHRLSCLILFKTLRLWLQVIFTEYI